MDLFISAETKDFNKIRMKSIKYLIACSLGILSLIGDSKAQQDPVFTQYFFNPLIINSGYAGTRNALDVTLLVREQWVGIKGRPQTQTLTIHSPLMKNTLAVGGSIVRDQVGITNSTSIFGDFAYRLKVSRKSKLALGLKAGLNLLSADLTELANINPEDVTFAADIKNRPLPNFGASAYLWAKNYFVGLSVPKIIENELNNQIQDMGGRENIHLYLTGGYVFDLNRLVKFKPTFMARYLKEAPLSVDITANFLFDEKLWVGGAYRLGDSAGFLASYQISDQMRLGYSFDYTLSDIQSVTTLNSHEFMLNYEFFYKDKNFVSPRYF